MISNELLSDGMSVISEKTGVPIYQITGKSHKRKIVDARHIYCYVMKYCGFDYKQIANRINRDRSTVYPSIKKIENIAQYDREFRSLLEKAISDTINFEKATC